MMRWWCTTAVEYSAPRACGGHSGLWAMRRWPSWTVAGQPGVPRAYQSKTARWKLTQYRRPLVLHGTGPQSLAFTLPCRCVLVYTCMHLHGCEHNHAVHQPDAVRSLADMRALVASWQSAGAESRARGQIVDARPAARFDGTAPEPRAGMRAGHMPGAVNVPFSDMLTDGRYVVVTFCFLACYSLTTVYCLLTRHGVKGT